MAIFRLHKFPHVCRLCLEANTGNNNNNNNMVPLTTVDKLLDGTIGDFIASCTFATTSEVKSHLFPGQICQPCLEMVRLYAAFRAKMMNVSLLVNALVELRYFNTKPMTDLFGTQGAELRLLFRDLDLCSMSGVGAEELIDEFPQYEIASMVVEQEGDLEVEILSDSSQEAEPEVVEAPPKPPSEYDFLYDTDENSEIEVPPLDVQDLKQALANRKYRTKRCKKLIKCPKCSFSSYWLSAIQAHQLQHLKRESRTYKCTEPDCPAEPFKTRKELYRHRREHRLHICDICGGRFKTAHYLKIHSRIHTKQKLYPCRYCKKSYTQLRLPNHINQIHLAGYKHRCRTCGMHFKWKETLLVHERTHVGDLLLPCDQCDSKFNSKLALTNHRTEFHSGGVEPCKYCSETFHHRGVLLDHVAKIHGINLQFECDICIEPFETQTELNEHQKIHQNPQPLQCNTCLVQYPTEGELSEHVCITYVPHYICCMRDHRNPQRYNQHQLKKHGIRTNVRVKPKALLPQEAATRDVRFES